jgi:hypothetical protein
MIARYGVTSLRRRRTTLVGYFQLGQSYVSENPILATQLYASGLPIEPDDADGHTNLGLILPSQGDPENALRHLHKALTLGGEKIARLE